MKLTIRKATIEDSAAVYELIKALAVYENMLNDLTSTEEDLKKSIFEQNHAEVFIAEVDGVCAGLALYTFNFSTFVGKPTLFLEDIFVKEEFRKNGCARALFEALEERAKEIGCARIDWYCLDWNMLGHSFYESLGAYRLGEWCIYRRDIKE